MPGKANTHPGAVNNPSAGFAVRLVPVPSLLDEYHRALLGEGKPDLPRERTLARYEEAQPYLGVLFPFAACRPGDYVVQVGFHDGYVGMGTSQPILFALQVGGEGRVVAVDPDRRNVKALSGFTG